jgi:hypothetical protein
MMALHTEHHRPNPLEIGAAIRAWSPIARTASVWWSDGSRTATDQGGSVVPPATSPRT